MKQYHDILTKIKTEGVGKSDRTGVGTLSVFGHMTRYDLSEGFPILTTKSIHFPTLVNELLWFIRGDTDVNWLKTRKVTIWDEWATPEQCARFNRPQGQLGPVYGHQWRNFGATITQSAEEALMVCKQNAADGRPTTYAHYQVDGVPMVYCNNGFDQLTWLINEIKTNPNSRRLILTGWNPAEANLVALPPCHTLSQYSVTDGKLSCMLFQRSADTFLGTPYNIASYALLTHLLSKVCGLEVGELVYVTADTHLYSNHMAQVDVQLSRVPDQLPTLKLDADVNDLYAFQARHIVLDGYRPQAKIPAPVAV